jgi:protease-4
MLQGQINEVYQQFIDIVAAGRKLPRSRVESMATGWAWTGKEAKRMGLVDQVGTYEDAVELAADLGGIEGSYSTEVYGQNDLSDVLSALFAMESHLREISAALSSDSAAIRKGAIAK